MINNRTKEKILEEINKSFEIENLTLDDKCFLIAECAHLGQTRKDGQPYITHPRAVANFFPTYGVESKKLRLIALLHDVIEDSPLTGQDLFKLGVPPDVVKTVEILSRIPNEPYRNYISRVIHDKKARAVKEADLQHNLSDLERGSMRDKYELALWIVQMADVVLE